MRRSPFAFLTADVVLFRKRNSHLELLLIQRRNEPFQGLWALPGGFVEEKEEFECAARRELLEETGIVAEKLYYLSTFGRPDRDPRGRVVSVVFYGFSVAESTMAGDDALEASWFNINHLPLLAFDHHEIVQYTLSKIKESEISY